MDTKDMDRENTKYAVRNTQTRLTCRMARIVASVAMLACSTLSAPQFQGDSSNARILQDGKDRSISCHACMLHSLCSSVPRRFQTGSMKMILAVCLAMMVVITTADFTVHVEEQDRTFCTISTRLACTNACNGKVCTENCISSCGIFSRPFSYLCSPVAASTCTAATTAASPAAAGAPFTV